MLNCQQKRSLDIFCDATKVRPNFILSFTALQKIRNASNFLRNSSPDLFAEKVTGKKKTALNNCIVETIGQKEKEQ
jgi:hypothetical protein